MSLPIARARRKKVPSIHRSPNSRTRSHSRTESSKPRVVMSQASWSSPTSHSSLMRRSSSATRRQVLVRGEVAGLAVVVERRQVLDVADLDAEGVGDLLRRRAAAGPQLAVLPVAEELVGVALGPGTGVEHRLAVLDHQHGVGGLVAREVGVRGVGTEAVVGVVGAHLVGAGRQHQPVVGERRRELGAPLGGPVGHRVPRHVELAVAPALAHEGGVGGRHGGVVRLGLGLLTGVGGGLDGLGGVLGSGLAHAVTVRRNAGAPGPDRPSPEGVRQGGWEGAAPLGSDP